MRNRWVFVGAIFGFSAVIIGAFGTHGLRSFLDAKDAEIFRTATQYQMYHALALIALGLFEEQDRSNRGSHLRYVGGYVGGWWFSLGIFVFSGSLYGLALTHIPWFGAITPVGGLFFIYAWLSFAHSAYKAARR